MKQTVKVFILFLGLLALTSFTLLHKFYVSVTQVEYNQEENSLQIITRLFVDDIEDLLQERYNNTITLGEGEESGKVDFYLKDYMDQKMLFTVNRKQVSFNFIGKEYEEDLLICYLEIENITQLESVQISNQILMDLFEEQQNIIHVKKEKKRKSIILEKGNDTGMLKFSE